MQAEGWTEGVIVGAEWYYSSSNIFHYQKRFKYFFPRDCFEWLYLSNILLSLCNGISIKSI